MIAIIDYGVGNLFSLASSLKSLGLETKVTRDAAAIRAADHIILPGVGAFADAMAKLEATGLVPVIKQEAEHKPLLGICLGMQLLFEKSYEYGEHTGLGLIPGWTLCRGGKTTRCSSTPSPVSMCIMCTAFTPKTVPPTRWLPVSTASR